MPPHPHTAHTHQGPLTGGGAQLCWLAQSLFCFPGHTCSLELLCSTMEELLLRTAFLLFHSSPSKGTEEREGSLVLYWHSPHFLPNLWSSKSNQALSKLSLGKWHATRISDYTGVEKGVAATVSLIIRFAQDSCDYTFGATAQSWGRLFCKKLPVFLFLQTVSHD